MIVLKFTSFLVIFALYMPFAAYGNSTVLSSESNSPTVFLYSTGKPVFFIVVEKKSQRLLLFEQKERVELIKEFTCATGENPGQKIAKGDARTPEGIYYITQFYEDKKVTVFGSRAFHLDYPNAFDKNAGRNGDGIYIHGTNKTLKPKSTNGCITLNNHDLDILAPYLTINTIPVIVVESFDLQTLLQTRKLAKNDSQFNAILSELGLDLSEIDIEKIENLSFLGGQDQAITSIEFNDLDGDLVKYSSQKRAYLQLSLTNSWRTLHALQTQNNVPSFLAVHPVKYTGVKKAVPPVAKVTSLRKGDDLLGFVERWRSAWVSKDLTTYISCYSPTFKNGRLDLNGWRNKKKNLNARYDFINVVIKNIVVEWTDSGATVSFYQIYQSDKYKSAGTKMLHLVHNDNKWVIEKEWM